ncbi:MAG: flagellar biosynthesis anti-sigma factor FlgM [Fibrobacterota bacterium]
MRIEGFSQPLSISLNKKIQAEKKAEKPVSSFKSDSAQLSESGKSSSSAKSDISAARMKIVNTDEIRSDRIEDVKNKIENGFYNSAAFADKLADKLLSETDITFAE